MRNAVGSASDSRARGPRFDARPATYFRFSFRSFKMVSCQLLGKYVHEVLINRLGGLSLPRKNVVRLTDRPDMTLDVYRGRKTTTQHNTTLQQQRDYFYWRLKNEFEIAVVNEPSVFQPPLKFYYSTVLSYRTFISTGFSIRYMDMAGIYQDMRTH